MIKQLKQLLVKNLTNVAKTKIGPSLISKVMERFNLNLIGKVSTDDPSAPEHFQNEFMSMLEEQITNGITVTSNGVHISFGNVDELGYNGTVETPLQTMVFIIEGILGEYAFINPATYSSVRNNTDVSFGRWGGGFLISRETFVKEGWGKTLSWSKVRWGFSNTGPINVFDINSDFISETINETINSTIKEFAATLRATHGKK